jgi:hypothetical protein
VDPRALLTRLLEHEREVDKGLHRAMHGKSMRPEELLALQANVMRYSQELEIASKLVEKLTGAVKQTLSTQV